MIAKLLNWIQKEGGWKYLVIGIGLLFLVISLATGVLLYFILGAISITTPRMIDKLEETNKKYQDKEDEIETRVKNDLEKIEMDRKKEESFRSRKERSEERENVENLPKKESTKELREKILDGIDDVGR